MASSKPPVDRAAELHRRAEEARANAERMRDKSLKDGWLDMAAKWDELARTAEQIRYSEDS